MPAVERSLGFNFLLGEVSMSKANTLHDLMNEAADLEARLKAFYDFLDGVISQSGNDVGELLNQLDVAMPYLSERIRAAGELKEKIGCIGKEGSQ